MKQIVFTIKLQVTVFHLFHFVLNHIGNEAVFPLRFLFMSLPSYPAAKVFNHLSQFFSHAIIPLLFQKSEDTRMKLRSFLAIIICKTLRLASRLLRRGGTAMPGRIAMKVCPDLLSTLSKNVTSVAITGTNGKTTCSRMIEEALSEAGLNYFANRSGANLMSGILTEYVMNCSITGRMKKDYAVIECDEAASKKVFGQIQPKVIVVTNLFRDQLDRYGEITHTLANIRTGIQSVPDAILCLNADCSLSSSLAEDDIPNRIVWFGINQSADLQALPSVLSDASRCIRCKAEYEYDYHTYAHLGGFRCPQCGYHRQTPHYAVTKIISMDNRHSEAVLRTPCSEVPLTVNLPASYNLYNAVAAVCAAENVGISENVCLSALSRFSCGFGRMENFNLAGGAQMILVKNPAGCTQALEFVGRIQGDYILVICLNDRDADGTDISWIWDANFELLVSKTEEIKKFYVSGDRADDMRVRLKYAGIPDSQIIVTHGPEPLTDMLMKETLPVYILPTYTAMLELRSTIIRRCGGMEFWE